MTITKQLRLVLAIAVILMLRANPVHAQVAAGQGVVVNGNFVVDNGGMVSTRAMRMNDGQYDITLTNTNGETTALVKDADGNVVFDGPYNTPAQMAKVPQAVAQRLTKMTDGINGIGLGWGGSGALAPNALVQMAQDPSRMLESQLKRIQQILEASDDEWRTLSIRVERVLKAQRTARPDTPVVMSSGGQTIAIAVAGGIAGAGQSPVGKAMAELRQVLKDEGAPADSIAAKTAGLRAARAKAEDELRAAQKDLKELLTLRQEAILAREGILD